MVDGEARDQHLDIGKHVLPDPGHRQISQHVLVIGQALKGLDDTRAIDERMVGQHHALGLAGGAGRVEHRTVIPGLDLFHAALDQVRIHAAMRVAALGQLLAGHQRAIGVVTQSARIVVDDVLQRRAFAPDLQHLVDLLLILDDDHGHACVLQDVDHFLRDGVLIERNRHGAQCLGRHHRHIELGTVFADHRDVVAALDAKLRQAVGHPAHRFMHLAPGERLPDPEVLLANRRPIAAHAGMLGQQGRKGVRRAHGDVRWVRHVVSL